jgi:hypothetical protein
MLQEDLSAQIKRAEAHRHQTEVEIHASSIERLGSYAGGQWHREIHGNLCKAESHQRHSLEGLKVSWLGLNRGGVMHRRCRIEDQLSQSLVALGDTCKRRWWAWNGLCVAITKFMERRDRIEEVIVLRFRLPVTWYKARGVLLVSIQGQSNRVINDGVILTSRLSIKIRGFPGHI